MESIYRLALATAAQARAKLDAAYQTSRIAAAEAAEIRRKLAAIAEAGRAGWRSEAGQALRADWGLA